jgi:type IV pilus assembly protein PilQ
VPPFQISQQPIVTASYDSATIAEVMQNFAALSGKSIVVSATARDIVVTAEVANQPWDVALRAILDANDLEAVEEPVGVIRVQSLQELQAADSLRIATEPLVTRVVQLNYAKAASLQPIILDIIRGGRTEGVRGSVVADTTTNSLIITDRESQIETTVSYIADLDKPTHQVSIQARIILVNRTGIEQLGLQYDIGDNEAFFNTLIARPDPATSEPIDLDGDGIPDGVGPTAAYDPEQVESVVRLGGNALAAVANAEATLLGSALSLIFSTAIGNFQLSSFLQASEEVRLSDLQAEPLIATAENTSARIVVGEETPIRILEAGAQQQEAQATVDYRETGIILEVTPHVTNNRRVLLDISAENSALQAAASDLGFTFTKQSAINQLLVNDGETAVIGGLTVSQVSVSKSGIPFLVDLPIIGGLFGFSQRQEIRQDLLILVTPHIIDDPTLETVGG